MQKAIDRVSVRRRRPAHPPARRALREASPPPSAATAHSALLARVEVLSHAEQSELVRRFQRDGDARAAAQLVASNLRLVVHIVRKYRPAAEDYDDLVAAGNLGLVEAIGRYEARHGIGFASYAAYWIRARVLDTVVAQRSFVHTGTRAMRKLFWHLARVRRELESAGVAYDRALLAERIGVRESELEALLPLFDRPVALDAPDRVDPSATVGATVPDPSAIDPEQRCAEAEEARAIARVARDFRGTLAARERLIWDRRLVQDEGALLSDLGSELGLSKERVRQLEASIKQRLREWVLTREPELAAS